MLTQFIFDSEDVVALQDPALLSKLANHINDLILNNFDQLIYLLYRIDVSEQKLKTILKENTDADAGRLIAALMIERQIQKIKSRQEYKRDKNMNDDNEKW